MKYCGENSSLYLDVRDSQIWEGFLYFCICIFVLECFGVMGLNELNGWMERLVLLIYPSIDIYLRNRNLSILICTSTGGWGAQVPEKGENVKMNITT